MPTLNLTRTGKSSRGTFGKITDENNKQICLTCERPDNGNQPMGCIPEGSYKVVPFQSPNKGRVLLLQDVPGRTMIEMHVGNTIADTEGCIIVGSLWGSLKGRRAVLYSRTTLDRLLTAYPVGFQLNIGTAPSPQVLNA